MYTLQDDEYRAIRNLLALIHGDNGDYASKHGLLDACEDAKLIIDKLKIINDYQSYIIEQVRLKVKENLVIIERELEELKQKKN